MSSEPQLFRINPENRQSDRIQEVDFARLGLRERQDIQEWVAANPGILGDGLLIIGKEFSGFDRTNERLDLLAVDSNGRLVIVELKRTTPGPTLIGRPSNTPATSIVRPLTSLSEWWRNTGMNPRRTP